MMAPWISEMLMDDLAAVFFAELVGYCLDVRVDTVKI
jgi:hypothetical protein